MHVFLVFATLIKKQFQGESGIYWDFLAQLFLLPNRFVYTNWSCRQTLIWKMDLGCLVLSCMEKGFISGELNSVFTWIRFETTGLYCLSGFFFFCPQAF